MASKASLRPGIPLVVALLLFTVSKQNFVQGQGANFNTTGNFRAESYATIAAARGVLIDGIGDILVVSDRVSRISAIFPETDGTISSVLLVDNSTLALTHGIAFHQGFLYASSVTTVYRWPYISGQRAAITVSPEVVIKDIPGSTNHITRTLKFHRSNDLYVSIGSDSNVDPDSSMAKIRRFDISAVPSGGFDFNSGLVIADGLRNEVGLAFDEDGVLWGVQNGADDLFRADLGGDIHNTNPADELTKYDQPIGTFYGYPYCWTVDNLTDHAHGSQLAWPDFMSDGVHTDEWCKNVSNNHPPTLPLPAHHAAVGITFYDAAACNSSVGAFPCSMKGDAFVAFRGSWNREPAEGYRVARIPIDPDTKLPTGEILVIMYEPDPVGCSRCFRPVDVAFNHQGHLIVSADVSNEVFRVWHE